VRNNLRIVLLLLVLSGPTGCGGSGVKLAGVSGVVTLDGRPVPGATIVFQPHTGKQSGGGPESSGRCDSEGRFTLKTIHGETGAVVAVHKVMIYPEYVKTGGNSSDVGGQSVVGPDIPHKYNYESKLIFKVPPEGTTSADFQLTSDQ
jgi:hypothetical protein